MDNFLSEGHSEFELQMMLIVQYSQTETNLVVPTSNTMMSYILKYYEKTSLENSTGSSLKAKMRFRIVFLTTYAIILAHSGMFRLTAEAVGLKAKFLRDTKRNSTFGPLDGEL